MDDRSQHDETDQMSLRVTNLFPIVPPDADTLLCSQTFLEEAANAMRKEGGKHHDGCLDGTLQENCAPEELMFAFESASCSLLLLMYTHSVIVLFSYIIMQC